jgi:ceramide glucosyltransferase
VPAFWLLFLPAVAYQALAIFAALRHVSKRTLPDGRVSTHTQPGVSVLKPIRGLDPNTYEAFVSQVQQHYPAFEVLFGVANESDPAVAEIRRLQAAFPSTSIRLILCPTVTPNGKVGALMDLSREARYPVWVVNDSDIKVTRTYLSQVVAPLSDSSIGVVTCPYRAYAHSAATRWEALGIATDFMPSTLVAQQLHVREFGLGSTLAFRAADLQKVGGFEALGDYLADDYQLAKRISSLGKRSLLSTYTVETSLGESTWASVWNHQLRWARTIRVSKGGGYAGLPITHAGLWILIAVLCGAWWPALILVCLRIGSGLATGWLVLRSPVAAGLAWLAPLWDLYAFAIWVTSYAGNEVRWRDKVLTVDGEGRIRD